MGAFTPPIPIPMGPHVYICPLPDCSDEPSNYLDSRHDTSVADSSSSLGCGSEQLPPPCLLPLLPLHLPTPHRTLPWRGDDDSNCMYYTTTCNTMGHGSIGLTLSMPARLAACLAFARVRAASHCPLPAQRMIQDDESEMVWGDPDHRLMTMRHLSDEPLCCACTTPYSPRTPCTHAHLAR